MSGPSDTSQPPFRMKTAGRRKVAASNWEDARRLFATVAALRPTPNLDFSAGVPRPLLETRARYTGNVAYDVSADGQRFLINSVVVEKAASPLTVVLNWTAGLKQ